MICEYIRAAPAPDNGGPRCHLTGKMCYAQDSPENCTRRTWALEYERKRQQGPPMPPDPEAKQKTNQALVLLAIIAAATVFGLVAWALSGRMMA